MTEPPVRSLASFDPRFAELLLRGARETFSIPCETEGQAYRLQMRMQQFRKRSCDAKIEGSDKYYDCVISLERKSATVVLRPRRVEFGSVLDKIAPANEALPSDPLATLEQEKH